MKGSSAADISKNGLLAGAQHCANSGTRGIPRMPLGFLVLKYAAEHPDDSGFRRTPRSIQILMMLYLKKRTLGLSRDMPIGEDVCRNPPREYQTGKCSDFT